MKEVWIGGDRITYRDEGQGTPVVFLHGVLVNGSTWRKVSGPLAQHFRCICPDLPLGGQRLAFNADADLSPPAVAALLARFLDALGLSSVVLVGNDTGGAYAQVFTALHPGRVERLVLCNCDAFEVFPPRQFAGLKLAVRIPGFLAMMGALFRVRPLLKSSLVLGLLSHALTGADIYRLYAQHFARSAGVRLNFRNAVLGWSSCYTEMAAALLTRYDKPVLLIWGADDHALFPRALGERLAAVFPQAQLVFVEQALTYVQEDQPAAFLAHLRPFLTLESKAVGGAGTSTAALKAAAKAA